MFGISSKGVRGAAILSLGFFALSGVSGLVYGEGVQAAADNQYEVRIPEGSRGSIDIMHGDYAAVIEKLHNGFTLDSDYAKNTNLCVAYTLQADAEEADTHCKKALSISGYERRRPRNSYTLRSAWKENYAIALNNLGVLCALQGDRAGASKYFQRAEKNSPRFDVGSQHNLEVLARAMEAESSNVVVASY